MTPDLRRALQIAETEVGVLRVDAARLEGILADPAHRSAAKVAAGRRQTITRLLADLDDARAELKWGTDLLARYVKQAERQGRRVQVYSESVSMDFDLSVTMRIGGPNAFGWLKGERAGGCRAVHGRVEVLPVAVSYDGIYVDEDDVEVFEQRETSSCGGPLPDDVRATHRNRTGAWTWLRARLLHLRQAETHDRFLGGAAGTVIR